MKIQSDLHFPKHLALGIALAVILQLMVPIRMDAFSVTKDINNAKLEEKIIFKKGMPADQLQFVDSDNCKFSVTPDGSLDCRITGNAEVKAIVKWKPASGLPPGLASKDYDYLIITCRVEGNNLPADGKGKPTRAGNMWLPVVVFDANNELLGSANLADAAPDGNTPDKTVELKFPMSVVTFWGPGGGDIAGVGFTWGTAAAKFNRDYHIVIDKIALAKIIPS